MGVKLLDKSPIGVDDRPFTQLEKNQELSRFSNGITIGLYGFGRISQAISLRLLSENSVGDIPLRELRIYSNNYENVNDLYQREFSQNSSIDQSAFEKVVVLEKNDLHKTIHSDDVLIVADQRKILSDQKKGIPVERRTMTGVNINIMLEIGRQINRTGRMYGGIINVITNPPETLVELLRQNEYVDDNRIIGGVHVDTLRVKKEIELKTGIDPDEIEAYGIGMHGDIVVHCVAPQLSDNKIEGIEEKVNQGSKKIVQRGYYTDHSTAEAAFQTLKAICDQESVVVAGIPYYVRELRSEIVMSMPVTFTDEGAELNDETLECMTERTQEQLLLRAQTLLNDRNYVFRKLAEKPREPVKPAYKKAEEEKRRQSFKNAKDAVIKGIHQYIISPFKITVRAGLILATLTAAAGGLKAVQEHYSLSTLQNTFNEMSNFIGEGEHLNASPLRAQLEDQLTGRFNIIFRDKFQDLYQKVMQSKAEITALQDKHFQPLENK